MSELFDREGIDETELFRIMYRMVGEAQPPKLKTAMQPRNGPEKDPGGYQPGQAVGGPAIGGDRDPGCNAEVKEVSVQSSKLKVECLMSKIENMEEE